jgi:hypothetical protein
MLQLLDFARENAVLKRELLRLGDEIQAVQRVLVAGPDTHGKGNIMPRIIQLAPDGSGRYIAVDRDGDLWRGEMKRQTEGGEEYVEWKPLPSQFPRDTTS